jgi:hypothetical protein
VAFQQSDTALKAQFGRGRCGGARCRAGRQVEAVNQFPRLVEQTRHVKNSLFLFQHCVRSGERQLPRSHSFPQRMNHRPAGASSDGRVCLLIPHRAFFHSAPRERLSTTGNTTFTGCTKKFAPIIIEPADVGCYGSSLI